MTVNGDIRIVGLCGSLRHESKTRVAVEEKLDAVDELGVITELIELRSYVLPELKRDSESTEDAKKTP